VITRKRVARVGGALVVVGALAVTATAQGPGNTMPTRTPSDARGADMVVNQTTVPKNRVEAARASSYTIGRNGPRVLVGRTTTRQFTGFQTFTVVPPSGRDVYQGFATISGGNAGVFGIRSTRVLNNGRYQVQVSFPGEQGTPGRLVIRVQTFPKDG
jgi:hypothetical protein